ncbi:MAG TPA: prephenate dehydrogenase/arogenate dehydrogenase family protein [Thermoanaerobaculia bacterium]|nr:prephenate dehydrogenase/arogenate dehydrogenase family protein [Thermoanaerobaculia bacterium]
MTATDPLVPLRDSIADLDRALLELLRRRMELAGEVGRLKAGQGAPIVVRDVEDQVLSRARQHAASCGVSEEVLEAVFRAIIRGSVERQHRVGIALRKRRGERVLIVGGAGGMGSWFETFFALAGHRVDILDPALAGLPSRPGRFAAWAELAGLEPYGAVLVAVPLARTAELVAELAERAPRGLVIEISSIKDPLSATLERAGRGGVRVLALHPMFGPGKSPYEPLTFVLAAQRDPEVERREIEPFLSHPYTRLVTVPFPHHDRLMGWLLGLSHLTSMLFGAALTRSGVAPGELHDCASTTFIRQAATARSVLGEDTDLYLDIQRLNPFRADVYQAVREALAHLETLVAGNDRAAWREALAAARQTLAEENR